MNIIDVTDWEKEEYPIGTRKKFIYIEPKTRQKAFFKYPKNDAGLIAVGEIWSEKVAADVGRIINVPTPNVFIARNEEGYGSLSFSFLEDGQQLHHGAEFLDAYFKAYDYGIFDPKDINHHRLEFIIHIAIILDFLPDFIDIIVFDALIGNTDRHSENWGLISNMYDNKFKLAPAYDNSSSLGREFYSDQDRLLLINDEKRFNKYVFGKKATACIAYQDKKRVQHFELIKILLQNYRKLVRNSISKVALLSDITIDNLLSNIPDFLMNDVCKILTKKILKARRDKLLELRR